MKNSSDKMFEKFKGYDFADAKPVAEISALAKLQSEAAAKTRITMRVDNSVLLAFKARAATTGGNYQTLMNEALRAYAQGETLAEVVRKTIREELKHAA